MTEAAARSGLGQRLKRLSCSRWVVLLALGALLPLWGTTRLGAWTRLVENPSGGGIIGASHLIVGVAAAPRRFFPWYYDEHARVVFLSQNEPTEPFGTWPETDPADATYEHFAPLEPGMAFPLRLMNRVFGVPLSVPTLAGIQLGVDVAVLAGLGLLGFELGGPLAALLGMWIYAGWLTAAAAAVYPFYYYWPIAFSVTLGLALALTARWRDRRRWWVGPLVAGLLVGGWCWFRGTGVSAAVVTPLLVAASLGVRHRSWRGAAVTLVATGLVLAPAAAHHWPRNGALMPRATMWHDLYIGLGTRPNPYGIVHQDQAAHDLARTKYGATWWEPAYERALRAEYLAIARANPGLILRNFILNFADAMTGWSFAWDPSRWCRWFWLSGLLGVAALVARRDRRAILLASVVALWAVQCATLAAVGRPQESYLWETIGLAVVAGAAGMGALVEMMLGRLVRMTAPAHA